jgi:hypothetical protein
MMKTIVREFCEGRCAEEIYLASRRNEKSTSMLLPKEIDAKAVIEFLAQFGYCGTEENGNLKIVWTK